MPKAGEIGKRLIESEAGNTFVALSLKWNRMDSSELEMGVVGAENERNWL